MLLKNILYLSQSCYNCFKKRQYSKDTSQIEKNDVKGFLMSDVKKKTTSGAKKKNSGFRKKSATDSFPIVCLGASAGGLRSLEAFLSNVPQDCGMAFVVISHTDPERTSLLPDILNRKSGITVKTVEDGQPPEQNTVYLPPSNKDLVMDQGKFHLKTIERKNGLHLPIDRFLESLSQACGELAGCVILSGTGTDGTHGLRLIKETGGVTLAEAETSAGHYGMPQSAIETGMVDFILEPARMPGQLISYFERPATFEDTLEMRGGGG